MRAQDLLENYDLFLLDAYGVLTTSSGAIPGAKEFLNKLRQARKMVRVLSNDCSRTRETALAFYRSRGFDFEIEEILTAGFASARYFRENGYEGFRCAVLGTSDTLECVRRAGGVPVDMADILKGEPFDLIYVGDDSGFEVLPTLNAVLTTADRSIKEGRAIPLVTGNPDLLYQKSADSFGFTSGSLAALLEAGLKELNPGAAQKVQVIGKPNPFLFRLALESTGVDSSRAVMIGDQLMTDILGANRADIDACLVGTGLTRLPLDQMLAARLRLKFVISDLT